MSPSLQTVCSLVRQTTPENSVRVRVCVCVCACACVHVCVHNIIAMVERERKYVKTITTYFLYIHTHCSDVQSSATDMLKKRDLY